MNAKAINRFKLMDNTDTETISAIIINRNLTIASMILEMFQAIFVLRWLIIFLINGIKIVRWPWFFTIITAFSIITVSLELSWLLMIDFQEPVPWYLNTLPYFRFVSILIT